MDTLADIAALTPCVLFVTVMYAAACALWPLKACGSCRGTGMIRSFTGRAFRVCSRCAGTGGRPRLGRRLYDMYRRNQP